MMIAVIGGEQTTLAEGVLAYETGREIGRRGHVLIGGGRDGAMREACRGAREAGGHTIGILPGDDRSQANEFVEFAIVTGMGHARNAIIARTADAFVAIGGRYGTLSEIAFALNLGKPVAGLSTWQATLPTGDLAPIITCATPAQAVDACEHALAKE